MLTYARTLCVVFGLLAAAAARAACPGDCDGDGEVSVGELVTAVGIVLGDRPLAVCQSADVGGDGAIGIAELVTAVRSVLVGCPPEATPTAPSTFRPVTATVGSPAASPSPTRTPTATATSAAGNQDPPTRRGELGEWLEAGSYLGWAAESAPHPSSGPHFGNVRVYVNDRLLDSLQRGLASHPSGAATVKELYASGTALLGWSVMVKVQDDSDGGRGWYWYERFNDTQYANGRGEGLCTGCHAAGRDFIRIPFPLQ